MTLASILVVDADSASRAQIAFGLRELGHEVSVATQRIAQQIGNQVNDANRPPAVDAGASEVPELVQDQLEDVVGHVYARDQRLEAAQEAQLEP